MPSDSSPVTDLIRDGRMSKDPGAVVDPVIYDPTTGKPVEYGNSDPNSIGADDKVEFHIRSDSDYPDLPHEVRDAEIKYILPVARHIADQIGITVIDEFSYEKMIDALRSRFLFVVINLRGVRISDGIASWIGIVIMCKKHPVVTVQLKMRLATRQIGIYRVKTWEKAGKRYVMHGDQSGASFLSREEATALIFNYLNTEGVVPGI